jgi:GDP-4-dehydro-6-deoxy-D-mannose reductase
MMNWLITGGSGFTGKFLIEAINRKYPEEPITILDQIKPEFKLHEHTSFIKIDLLNEQKVKKTLNQLKPNRIIHLVGVMRDEDPVHMVKINVMTCGILLNVLKEILPIDGFLVIGSVAQYGNTDPIIPPRESDPCIPNSFYGHTKLLQEKLALSYFHEYQIPVICTRPCNIIGPNQSKAFVIPYIIHQLLVENRKYIELDHINSGRDYIDVRDITNAYIHLFQSRKTRGEVFNIGNNKLVYLKEIIEQIKEILNRDIIDVLEKNPQSSSDIHLINSDKIRKYTSWETKYKLKPSLSSMIDYYR